MGSDAASYVPLPFQPAAQLPALSSCKKTRLGCMSKPLALRTLPCRCASSPFLLKRGETRLEGLVLICVWWEGICLNILIQAPQFPDNCIVDPSFATRVCVEATGLLGPRGGGEPGLAVTSPEKMCLILNPLPKPS